MIKCYRLKSVTPQHFISSQKKLLMRTLKSNLGKDVNLISIQDAPQGNLDILLYVRGVSRNCCKVVKLMINKLLN